MFALADRARAWVFGDPAAESREVFDELLSASVMARDSTLAISTEGLKVLPRGRFRAVFEIVILEPGGGEVSAHRYVPE
jgi:hypothetical protein